MKYLLLVSLFTFSLGAFGFENVVEFNELYREKSCRLSKAKAAERTALQVQSGSDIYDGSVEALHGRKIIRFVQKYGNCEAVYHGTLGMLYDYYLTVQVEAK